MAKATKEKKGESKEKSGAAKKADIPPEGTEDNPQENPLEKVQGEVDREWRCLTCSATAPPSASGYMTLIKHQCTGEKKIRLIALETGEELAAIFKEALNAGLLGKLKEERGPGEKQDSSRGAPQVTGDNNIRIAITLPAIDVALFNIARRTSESG
jgi:hypothetical protein